MKKEITAAVVVTALIATAGIGSTLAYLTDKTETPVVNTFTIGNVKIELDEPQWEAEKGLDMIPGAIVDKDPMVTNIGQADAFVGIRIDGLKAMVDQGFLVRSNSNEAVLDAGADVFAWNPLFALVDVQGNPVEAGADDILTAEEFAVLGDVPLFFAYEKALTAGEQTAALFDTVKLDEDVKVESGMNTITKQFMDADGNVLTENAYGLLDGVPAKDADGEYIYKITSNEEGRESFIFSMEIKAAAIQSTNASDADNWTALKTENWYSYLPVDYSGLGVE